MTSILTHYPIPERPFNAALHAENKILEANQLREDVLLRYKTVYQSFWGVSDPPTGSRYTPEQMQAVLDEMPQETAQDILADSSAYRNFLISAYGDLLEMKYRTPAFNLTAGSGRIVVGNLKDDWKLPVVEEPAPASPETP